MAAASTVQPSALPPDLLPFIDMTTLTQSELLSLSSYHHLKHSAITQDPPLIPAIDRSIFNESAGSRRQTYSRPSLHTHHRHRLAGLFPKPQSTTAPAPTPANSSLPSSSSDPDRLENRSIITALKNLLSSNPEFVEAEYLLQFNSFTHFSNPLDYTPVPLPPERKRKRGRKPRKFVKLVGPAQEGVRLRIVNKNGERVDLVKLGGMEEDPYKEELRRRTEGMEGEEELLEFFRGLDGEWGSRRRKRRIVEAGQFGDALPVGWKLLLGLKRKEGRAWVYSRRYISPNGQHFISCKDVAAYLQSFFGSHGSWQGKDLSGVIVQQGSRATSIQHTIDTEVKDQGQSSKHEKQGALVDTEILEEVQIHDVFECHMCNTTFDERNPYLRHFLTCHQRTARRFRPGSSVGDGVIVKDGKYECQFCHKVFHERHRYNGHVGVHVRNYVRGTEDLPGVGLSLQKISDPPKDQLPTRISKMDALIEIAQSSILEASSSKPNEEPNDGLSTDKRNVISNVESSDGPVREQERGDGRIDESPEPDLDHHNMLIDKIDNARNLLDVRVDFLSVHAIHGFAFDIHAEETHKLVPLGNREICGSENNVNLICSNRRGDTILDEMDKGKSVSKDNIIQGNDTSKDNVIQEKQDQPSQENTSVLLSQQSHVSSTSIEIQDKGETGSAVDKASQLTEVSLELAKEVKFGFGNAQEPGSSHKVPTDLENNNEIHGVYDATVQFESETNRQQLTTVCVWCGLEFSDESINPELLSGSVGFMCPNCKVKISGQLNVLDGGCS